MCLSPCGPNMIRGTDGTCIPGCAKPNQELVGGICVCLPEFELFGGVCVPLCDNATEMRNEITGNCDLICPTALEEGSTGVCLCIAGYERVNGVCVLDCPDGQNLINGVCRSCILNSSFLPFFRTCICNQGFTLNNNVCQPDPIQCPVGQRFRAGQNDCQDCRAGCSRCLRDFTCVQCPPEFFPFRNTCLPICGDGAIVGD